MQVSINIRSLVDYVWYFELVFRWLVARKLDTVNKSFMNRMDTLSNKLKLAFNALNEFFGVGVNTKMMELLSERGIKPYIFKSE